MATLDGLERLADVRWLGRVLDQVEPDLTAWAITNAPDPHAMPPVSQAEQAARDASDRALLKRWRA